MSNQLHQTSARPGELLCWPNSMQLLRLEKIIAELLIPWFQDWILSDHAQIENQAVVASECKSKLETLSYHYSLGDLDQPKAWISFHEPVELLLEKSLPLASRNSGASTSKVLPQLAQIALYEFREKLLPLFGHLSEQTAPPPTSDIYHPWSGAVVLAISSPVFSFYITLTPELTQLLSGSVRSKSTEEKPRPELTTVLDAIKNQKIQCRVVLSGCELDIQSLQNLNIDDVIQLPHRLDETVIVKSMDNEFLFNAFLGRKDSQKAIEIVSNDAISNGTKENND